MPTEVLCTLQTAMEPNPAYWYPPGSNPALWAGQVVWSLDAKRVRFTLYDESKHVESLWEITTEGKDMHPLFPGWQDPPMLRFANTMRTITICSSHGKIPLGRTFPRTGRHLRCHGAQRLAPQAEQAARSNHRWALAFFEPSFQS